MPWVKLDDGVTDHPKLAVLSPEAFVLWLRGLCYSSRHGLDGRVPMGALRVLCPSRQRSQVVEELTGDPPEPYEVALWVERDDHFEIHDFLEYQPSRADIATLREQSRERVKRWRKRKRNAVTNATTNAVSNGRVTALVTPTSPYPLEEGTDKSTSCSTAEGSAGGRKLTPQQVAVGRVVELYQGFELPPPKPSLVGKWLKLVDGDVAALLARLEEVMLAGRLQEVEQPTAFAAKVVSRLAGDLQRGVRPPRAVAFDAAAAAAPSVAQRSALRTVLLHMREALAAGDDAERREAEHAVLRGVFADLGWEWVDPSEDLVARLEGWIYPSTEAPR